MAYTVLLIDYDPKSIARIREVVSKLCAQVVVARCGRSGLEQHRRVRPDLTLIQDLIPNLHGFEVCKQIKGAEDGDTHPVVLLCAPNSHSVLIDTGCDAYLKKPYGDDELLEVLRTLLPAVDALAVTDGSTSGTMEPDRINGAGSADTNSTQTDSFEAEIVAHLDAVLELSA